jgi:hypothetical protein
MTTTTHRDQRLESRLREVRVGAIDDARRRLKPSIAALGLGGIPIRNEFELELPLGASDG